MTLVYPRLGDSHGLERLAEMRQVASDDPEALEGLVHFAHPSAEPVPTGGSVASESRIREVREAVASALDGLWSPGSAIRQAERAQFDRALGQALHASMRIVPADAAHAGTWTFMAAVVFPDLTWSRFPELHEERVLGGPRNTLRRPWFRQEILGDLLSSSAQPLGEDELVGLLERSALARNRRLVRVLADAVVKHEGRGRSEFARDLYKRVTHLTGPLLLDAVSTDELTGIVAALAQGQAWPSHPIDGEREVGSVDAVRPTELGEEAATQETSPGDLVLQFHREMEGLYRRIVSETSYKPSRFLSMINQQGGVETARQLAGAPNPSEGFTVLWELGRLDLSVEALVTRDEFRGLFTDDVIERAESRLEDHLASE